MKKAMIAAAAGSLLAAITLLGPGASTAAAGNAEFALHSASGNDWESASRTTPAGGNWELALYLALGNDWE